MEKENQIDVHIRWMIRLDMPQVLKIEKSSFEFPWSEEDFIRCLRQRNYIGMVAEFNETVVGFMIYELHENKLHVLNFAVRPDFRRRSVGTQMVEKLIGKLSVQRRRRITFEIRETNLAGQKFFSELGFKAISLLRNHYDRNHTNEDAYVMQYEHPGIKKPLEMKNRISRISA